MLDIPKRESITFTFDGREYKGLRGEVISSALFANGIKVFGKHYIDGFPQGIFCANGQCAQCLVMADGVPVKACITELKEGMAIRSLDGLPALPEDDEEVPHHQVPDVETEALIVGGGPAGLSAAVELGRNGVGTVVADDKLELGGKMSLQTHNFFGNLEDCYAGTRGMDIGRILADEIEKLDTVEVWLNSPVVGVFADKKFGVVRDGVYTLVSPRKVLISAGAREKALAFPGCDLPGVYGAGAFQTLVNRDLVRSSEKIFIVGGGNVGLIGAYHALQAGMEVVGIAEALPQCGGYKVHLDKLKRFGVPVFTSHTVLKAEGRGKVEKVTISRIDDKFNPVPGTEMEFEVDTLLIAVGLDPVDELSREAEKMGFEPYSAGDAEMIAEASAAMFSGKITGRRMLRDLGYDVEIPKRFDDMLDILRGKPGKIHEYKPTNKKAAVYPVLRCVQEIPCNPCVHQCIKKSIKMPSGKITDIPVFEGECIGCNKCVSLCPGLAITLVDRGHDETGKKALVILPWELPEGTIEEGEDVTTSGFEGEVVGEGHIIRIKPSPWDKKRKLVYLEVPWGEADRVAGIRIVEEKPGSSMDYEPLPDDDVIICRCERVTKGEIRREIRNGARDINALKASLRVGLGPCGGKTCMPLIKRIFAEEGVPLSEVEDNTTRPFTQEVPMSAFIKGREGDR